MKTTNFFFLSLGLSGALILGLGCQKSLPPSAPTPAATITAPDFSKNPPLRIAVAAMISPEKTRIHYEELLQLIGKKMEMNVTFAQKKTYAEVNELIKTQEVDLGFVCAGPYVKGHDEWGMEILAVPVVKGQALYYSYILAHVNSPITSWADLKGKKFAFTDPQSNTGTLVPRYMLSQMKQTPETYFKEFFYTHSHDNSIKAVAHGLADGAAVDSLIWDFMNAVDPVDTKQTKIIAKSPPYGIPPLVVHPKTPVEIKNKLKTILYSLHLNPEGAEILKSLQIEKFIPGKDSDYQSVRTMESWLAAQSKKADKKLEAQ